MNVLLKRSKQLIPAAVFAVAALAVPTHAFAASTVTATGTLAVSATVTSSITLTFGTSSTGVTLTGSGTNAATLPFGNISAYGSIPGTITRTVGAINFTVSSPVLVNVIQTNGSSQNFTLNAQLATSDNINNWSVGGVPVSSSSAASITGTGAYGTSGNSEVIALTVPFTTTNNTSINNTINFTATAN